MTTHSSILAWEVPWTEEPDGLQSMGPQRVRHDRVSTAQQREREIMKKNRTTYGAEVYSE